MNVEGIGGSGNLGWPRLGGTEQTQNQGPGPGGLIKGFIDRTDLDQQTSAKAIEDYISGKNSNVLPVVQAVAKADMSFKMLVSVRNKVIDAYKQVMNMQV